MDNMYVTIIFFTSVLFFLFAFLWFYFVKPLILNYYRMELLIKKKDIENKYNLSGHSSDPGYLRLIELISVYIKNSREINIVTFFYVGWRIQKDKELLELTGDNVKTYLNPIKNSPYSDDLLTILREVDLIFVKFLLRRSLPILTLMFVVEIFKRLLFNSRKSAIDYTKTLTSLKKRKLNPTHFVLSDEDGLLSH